MKKLLPIIALIAVIAMVSYMFYLQGSSLDRSSKKKPSLIVETPVVSVQ